MQIASNAETVDVQVAEELAHKIARSAEQIILNKPTNTKSVINIEITTDQLTSNPTYKGFQDD